VVRQLTRRVALILWPGRPGAVAAAPAIPFTETLATLALTTGLPAFIGRWRICRSLGGLVRLRLATSTIAVMFALGGHLDLALFAQRRLGAVGRLLAFGRPE
jgi:hypothetical protein